MTDILQLYIGALSGCVGLSVITTLIMRSIIGGNKYD